MMKRNSICKLVFLTAAATAASITSALAAPLSLDAYISQVAEKNPGLKAAESSARGYEMLSSSADVLTSPYVFGNFTNLDDKQETSNPAFQGNRTQVSQYTVGLGMNTRFGLNARYSFNTANTELLNATLIPLPKFNTAYNRLELTQSLLKNGFGSETRAQVEALAAANRAQSYAARFSAISQIVNAENAYWRLAFARRNVEIQKDVLTRANRALEWAKRRVNMQLGDKSDLLQAQAAHDLRRLEMINAEEEARNAARSFNTIRYVDGFEVQEDIMVPSIEETVKVTAMEKEGIRLDIKAAEERSKAAVANAQLDRERVKPTLDLFANLAWNGRDASRPEAIKESFRSNHSATAYGVNVSVPLAFSAMRDGIRGTDYIKENAVFTLEQQRLDEALSWNELSGRFQEARTRLNLLRTIEAVQREKYENERQRLLRGRTTTYQALTFEQDYAQTQLSTLRTQNEVLQLRAQMKLFRGEQ